MRRARAGAGNLIFLRSGETLFLSGLLASQVDGIVLSSVRVVAGDAPFVAWPGGCGLRLQSSLGAVSAVGVCFLFCKMVVP